MFKKKVLAVGFGEAAVALCQIRRDRKRSTVKLIDEKVIPARERLGAGSDHVSEIDGLLIDLKIFE